MMPGPAAIRPRDFRDILSKLPDARQSGDEWIAPCPAPGHKTPKAHLSLKDAGDKALGTCQGGQHTYQDLCAALGFDSLSYSANGSGPEAKIEATYDYVGVDGRLLYQVVRFEPKAFRQRRPDGNRGWLWNLKGVKPVLYHLPEVLKATAEGRTIYICEGEKDADNLRKIGLTATTNSGGAEKWRLEYGEVLAGGSVVILPDKDAAGRRHTAKVATSLHRKVQSLKVIELQDLNGLPVKDVSDWLVAGGTRAQLERLASEAPEWKPPQGTGDVALVCLGDVQPEAVSWLWHPYIPVGKLTLLEGDPGVGKSWVSLAIATAVSLGRGLPGRDSTEPQTVLLASAEDGLGDTIRPRLDRMEADVAKIHAIKGALDFGDGGLAVLGGYIEMVKPGLVIIDPLVAFIGATVDIHRANETRAVMARLASLAEKHACAILAVRHLNKGQGKPLYRGLGSIDFAAACRSVLLAGQDPEDPQKRALVHIKSNLAPMGAAIGYKLWDGRLYWTGESNLTADRILAAGNSEEDKSARDEAADFLRDELVGGPVEAAQVWRAAKEAGLAEATVKRAKASLGVITRRHGKAGKRGGGKFTWELPANHLEAQKDLEYQGSHIEKDDTLNQNSFKLTPGPKTDDTLNPPETLPPARADAPPCSVAGCGEGVYVYDRDGLGAAYCQRPAPPEQPCPVCESSEWWHTPWGAWVCARYHPNPRGNVSGRRE